MNIVLIGYMASGKSAIGRFLSDEMQRAFCDLDDYIEVNEGMKITKIFSKKGEVYFRKIESFYLKQLLVEQHNSVISLGGGTPCYADNMNIILKEATVFYLNASISTIEKRLLGNATKRPLVKELSKDQLKEYIAKHLFERRAFYEQAHHIIDVNNKKMTHIVLEIKNLLQSGNRA